MTKTLCELDKLLKNNIKEYMELVRNPSHLCRKCGRAANSKKYLCKPVKMKPDDEK